MGPRAVAKKWFHFSAVFEDVYHALSFLTKQLNLGPYRNKNTVIKKKNVDCTVQCRAHFFKSQ